MPTLREWGFFRVIISVSSNVFDTIEHFITDLWQAWEERCAPVSYGVKDAQGEMFFVEAHSFDVDGKGRLRFWEHRLLCRRLISVVQADEWQRILEGVSLEDFKRGEGTWPT